MTKIICKKGYILLFTVILLHLITQGNGRRTKEKMYEKIQMGSACFRRLNSTHQTGCTSKRGGSTGVIHYCDTQKDLDFILTNGTAGPYIPVLPTTLFNTENFNSLVASQKVSGLILFHLEQPTEFSHEYQCPNQRFNVESTCKKWNPYGTGLLYRDIPFPVFYVEDDIIKIKECFVKFNNFSYETQNDRPLCSLELKSFMYATKDTPTCKRRSSMEFNLNPVKVCDPLGDYNVWASLFPLVEIKENSAVPKKDDKYVVIASRLDTTSLFDKTPGADNPVTSIVTLLSVAKLLKDMVKGTEYNGKSNVLFVFFNGESYDYIGSQRLLYDMQNNNFPLEKNSSNLPTIRPENVSLFIELNQLSNSKGVYAHFLNDDDPVVAKFYANLMYNSGSQLNFNPVKNSLPPASLHTFLRDYPKLSGLVLTDHEHEYVNKYYNSIYDNASNIDYVYYNVSEENSGEIPKDSLQWHIANVTTMVAKSVFEQVTGTNYTGNASVDVVLVDELLYCYLEDPNCRVRKAVQKTKIPKVSHYLYVGVDRVANLMTQLTGLILSWHTGEIVSQMTAYANRAQTEFTLHIDTNCTDIDKNEGFRYFTFPKSIYELNVTRCYRTTSNITEAVSPAFILDDYDWSSNKYSTWAESTWSEVGVTMFLRPSSSHETMTLVIGTMSMVFSFIVVYFVKSRSQILFTPPIPTEPPANC